MLNNADLASAILAIVSAIVITIPLFKRPPKYPTTELEQDSVLNSQGVMGVQAATAFRKLNKEMFDAYVLQRRCTGLGLALLVASVVWGLVGAALG